jgi:hypothetical protein
MSYGRLPRSSLRYGPLDEEVMLLNNFALFAVEDGRPIHRI